MGHFLCVVRIGGGYGSYCVGIGILNTLKLVGSPTSPAGCLEKTTQDQLSRVARSVLGWLQCVASRRNSGKSGEKAQTFIFLFRMFKNDLVLCPPSAQLFRVSPLVSDSEVSYNK